MLWATLCNYKMSIKMDRLVIEGICESMDSQVTGAATVLAQCEATALSE